jgi:hypothetical protein
MHPDVGYCSSGIIGGTLDDDSDPMCTIALVRYLFISFVVLG